MQERQPFHRCPACGGACTVEERCPTCGIALLPVGDPAAAGAAAEHVSLIVGDAPRIVGEDGQPDDAERVPVPSFDPEQLSAEPPPPNTGSSTRRRYAVVGTLVAVAALAVFALVVASRDRGSRELRAFVRHLDAPNLAPVAVVPALDADARLAELERGNPGALGVAVPSLEGAPNVHALGDALVGALADTNPWAALHWGRHPHPERLPGDDLPNRIAALRLLRDALREVERLSADARLTPHDRLDLTVLRGVCESGLRAGLGTDHDRLVELDWILDTLTWLRDIRCCDAASRAAAACAVLECLPETFAKQVGRLETPALPEVLAVANHLDEDREWLAGYAASWIGVSAEDASQLEGGAVRAGAAVDETVRALRTVVAERAHGALGIGRERIAAKIRAEHRLPYDVRDVYEFALAAFRGADDTERRLALAADDGFRPQSHSDESTIAALWRSVERWVPQAPPEPGIGVARPRSSMRHRAGAMYFDAGALAHPSAGVIVVEPIARIGNPEDLDADRVARVHVLAHESYPGHRLQAHLQRAACTIRRCFPDRCALEGWASYAEDLFHETGGCTPGVLDDWVRAGERRRSAQSVLVELLCATGAAEAPVLMWLSGIQTKGEAGLAELGAVALRQGDQLAYLVGRNEILRLRDAETKRLGAAFDLRDFHRRLLEEGSVPVRRIEEAWASERR